MNLTNNNKIKIFTSLICIALLVTGCDVKQNLGGGESDNYTDGRVIGTIHGVVKAAHSGARLKDITVTTVVKGETYWVFTNDVGHYAITNLSPGNYELTFSGSDGYAIMSTEENIPTLQEAGVTNMATSEDFHYTTTQDMSLYSLSAGLTGTVYTKQDDENTTLAGAGVTVIANYEEAFSPSWFSAVTDSNGVYSFSNLPATETNIITMPFSDGTYDYDVALNEVGLLPGVIVTNDPIILQIATAEPFVLTNNFENDDFGLTESLTMTFSKTMDASSFDITLSSEYGNVAFESSWTNDITLTIDPLVTLQANTTYSLSLSGDSQDNNSYSDNDNFETLDGIEFISTNLERVDGVFDEFSVTSNIEIMFTMEVDLNNYNGYAALYDDEGGYLVSTSLSTDSTTLIIDPLYNLEPGQVYTLYWEVYSMIEGDYDDGVVNFVTMSDVTAPAQVTGFSRGAMADWNTTSLFFMWNTLNGADGYRIYAKDNGDNTDFIRIATYLSGDYVTGQSATVSLPSQFDYYDDDGIQTPFTGGTELTFQIVAYNDAGEGTYSASVTVGDETSPVVTSFNQSGTADNPDSTSTQSFTVDLSANEYLSGADPTFGFVESGGDTNYVLPNSSVSLDWDSDMMGGTFTVVVPAGKDGSGDEFFITNLKDASENASSDTVRVTLD